MWRCGFDTCLYNNAFALPYTNINQMQATAKTERMLDDVYITSTDHTAVIDKEGDHVLLGYVSFRSYFSSIDLRGEGPVQCYAQLEVCTVETGGNPLDLMTADIPGILDLGKRGRTRIFVLINWMFEPRTMRVHIGKGEVFEFRIAAV